jgi:predicted aspartyl protease
MHSKASGDLDLVPIFRSSLRHLSFAITLILPGSLSHLAFAIGCPVRLLYSLSEADRAYLRSDYDRAASLYQKQLEQKPSDPELISRLVRVLLLQEKVTEADALVQNALSKDPKAVPLLVALGEIQFRQGTPWFTAATVAEALKLDPCSARAHLLYSRLASLHSQNATAQQEITSAHALDPHDPQIISEWIGTLSLRKRASELETYLSQDNGEDKETLDGLYKYLDSLKQKIANPLKSCRLTSNTQTTTIPLALMLEDITQVSAFGLDVQLNGKRSRLVIDTGAGGIVISGAVAERAGLKKLRESESGGIGDSGKVKSYIAYADHITVGALEFSDCEVEVIDQQNVAERDGLIGMDVFSRFLVTLAYPDRKLILGPLPPRPGDSTSNKASLETDGSANQFNQADLSLATDAADKPPVFHDRYIDPSMETWTKIYRIGHMLMIPTSLNNSKLKTFILDTGAFSTTISSSAAREVTKVREDDRISITGISGKVKKVYSADEITFRFANISQRITNVVSFDSPENNKALGMEISGLIGLTALGQMTISIDYRDGLAKFSYNNNPHLHTIEY